MSASSIEIVDKRSSAIEQQATAMSPMQELQMQIVRTGDLEKLKELRAIEKEWREDQAKQAFNVAFAAFKGEAVRILRTREIKDGPLRGKKHAELGVIVASVTPALSKHGLSISWRLTRDEKDWMEVSCTLRHIEGHSESVTMGGAPDAGPGRNAIQARGSAKTYLERYTSTAILGLAPEDADDDGAGAGKQEDGEAAMEGAAVQDFISSIEGSGDLDELQRNYFAARDAATKAGDTKALNAFAGAKNALYKTLAKRAK